MHTVSLTEKRDGERGNVLFLILIAVALFAALSYAVTQSSRSGGGDAGKETNLVNSAQLTQYPAGIRTAIVRMIIGGADINSLEFNPPSAFGTLTDTSGVLGVFHPAGGGATYSEAPGDVMSGSSTGGEWKFNGENQIADVGTTDASGPTPATADIIAFLPGVSSAVCNKLNDELGLPATPPTAVTSVQYTDNMDSTNPGICDATCNGGSIGDPSATDSALDGQPFGCFDDGGTLVYYHVLVER